MSLKRIMGIGLAGGALASLAGVGYYWGYTLALVVNFSKVIGILNVVVACTLGCVLMTAGYAIVIKWKGGKMAAWLNVFYTALSFLSIIGVFSFSLPLDVASPELFPGLVIPMHFFPALAFMSVVPLMSRKTNVYQ